MEKNKRIVRQAEKEWDERIGGRGRGQSGRQTGPAAETEVTVQRCNERTSFPSFFFCMTESDDRALFPERSLIEWHHLLLLLIFFFFSLCDKSRQPEEDYSQQTDIGPVFVCLPLEIITASGWLLIKATRWNSNNMSQVFKRICNLMEEKMDAQKTSNSGREAVENLPLNMMISLLLEYTVNIALGTNPWNSGCNWLEGVWYKCQGLSYIKHLHYYFSLCITHISRFHSLHKLHKAMMTHRSSVRLFPYITVRIIWGWFTGGLIE